MGCKQAVRNGHRLLIHVQIFPHHVLQSFAYNAAQVLILLDNHQHGIFAALPYHKGRTQH